MAVTQLYTAVAGDVITAARWNNEFGNIYNNGTSVAFPLTAAVSLNGYTLTLDGSGVSTLSSSAATGAILTAGAKNGTPGSTGSQVAIPAATFTDTATAGSGTATSFTGLSLARATLAATNVSVVNTDAAALYIANSPAAGSNITITNSWSFWIDAGNARLDGNLSVQGETIASLNPYSFTVAMAANACTITLTTPAGVTPSASNPVPLAFRNVTATTPALATVLATAATTLVISSGSTLGTVSAVANRIWIGALNNAGTIELFAYNSLKAPAVGAFPQAYAGPSIIGISESGFVTTTAEGGAGASDTAQVPYSTSARTNVAFRWLGFFESTQATAGTWTTAASKVHMVTRGTKFPGETVQSVYNFDNNVATGTTVQPQDNTTPLITEGDQYLAQAITCMSACNVVLVEASFTGTHSVNASVSMQLTDGTSSLASQIAGFAAAATVGNGRIQYMGVANTTSAVTWAMRAGGASAGTTTFNGTAGAIRQNNMASFIRVTEVAI